MKRNHLIWIGPLIAVVGVLSYFMFFARFAMLRDFPWLNLPLVLLGAVLSLLGLRRALQSAPSRLGKVLAGAGLTLSLLFAGLFIVYIFWLSMVPPASDATLALVQAPDFALTSSTGETVQLSDFAGRKVALIFYRGFW